MNTMKDKTLLWKAGNLTEKTLKPGEFSGAAYLVDYKGSKEIGEVAADMARMGCSAQASGIAYVLQFFADNLPDMIATDGRRVNLGRLVSFYPRITGKVLDKNADITTSTNPVELKASTPAALRRALDGIGLLNVGKDSVNPSVTGEFDIASDAKGKVVVGSAARVVGTDLLIVADRDDEGVWLTSADGTVDMKMTVTVPKTATVDFTTPAGKTATDLPAGAYTLTVKTRDGRAAATKLYTLAIPVTVAAS
jgi:hypothetical protein